jgi:hypothetical protein
MGQERCLDLDGGFAGFRLHALPCAGGVAVRAHDVALSDLRIDLYVSRVTGDSATECGGLLAADVIELHHVERVFDAAVGTGSGFCCPNISSFLVALFPRTSLDSFARAALIAGVLDRCGDSHVVDPIKRGGL